MILDLDAIQARCDYVTDGPWQAVRSFMGQSAWVVRDKHKLMVASECEPGEAEFIAYSRTDIPALIARVRELEKAMKDALREFDKDEAWRAKQYLELAIEPKP